MSFNLYEFKTIYTNNSQEETKQYFLENFDDTTCSIFMCDYNGDSLPPLDFMVSNKMKGYIQMLEDKLRKSAFGLGYLNLNGGKFIWIFNDDDIPESFRTSTFYRDFNFTKISKTNEDIWNIIYNNENNIVTFK